MPLADATQQIDENVHHLTWSLGPLTVNGDTVFVTLITCAVLFLIALYIQRRAVSDTPGRFISGLEMMIEFVNRLVVDTLGPKAGHPAVRRLGPLAISLFMFLLISNLIGLFPSMHSPTNDVNTALALAIISILFLHVSSIRVRGGGGYVKHYFSVVQPKMFPLGWIARGLFAFLEVIQELSRPITLTFRLYFNIFVGELLLLLIVVLFPKYLIPLQFPLGFIWMVISIFVAAVQAFIFTVLTIAYVAMGIDAQDPHGTEEHGGDGEREGRGAPEPAH